LLGTFSWEEDIEEKLDPLRVSYENTCKEWTKVEAMVRLRDKAAFAVGEPAAFSSTVFSPVYAS
jgi:hypothetical protein